MNDLKTLIMAHIDAAAPDSRRSRGYGYSNLYSSAYPTVPASLKARKYGPYQFEAGVVQNNAMFKEQI